jgi:hypothetical protein
MADYKLRDFTRLSYTKNGKKRISKFFLFLQFFFISPREKKIHTRDMSSAGCSGMEKNK